MTRARSFQVGPAGKLVRKTNLWRINGAHRWENENASERVRQLDGSLAISSLSYSRRRRCRERATFNFGREKESVCLFFWICIWNLRRQVRRRRTSAHNTENDYKKTLFYLVELYRFLFSSCRQTWTLCRRRRLICSAYFAWPLSAHYITAKELLCWGDLNSLSYTA